MFVSPFRTRFRLGWPLLLACLAFVPLGILTVGRDQPEPVGAYLDGVFPDATPGQGTGAWQIVDAFPNLTFQAPVHLAQEPGSNRLFVAEKQGRIVAFVNDPNSSSTTVVLDLISQTFDQHESGLLYFAFHPDYAQGTRYLYVFWQYDAPGNAHYSRLSRFTISASTQVAVPGSGQVLIHQYDRSRNHNAGAMFFDDEGFLYLALGDEGGSNNQFGQGQSLDGRLFGGVIRIDPEMDPTRSHPIRRQPQQLNSSDNSYTAHYYIPNDNPWQDPAGGILEEFIALGLRNPHRMSHDLLTGTTWIADVGQNAREEIDRLQWGANYQWPFREGDVNGPQAMPSPLIGTSTGPFYSYPHSQGNNCIIGGMVYRGGLHLDLQGQYLFADNGGKRVWALDTLANGTPQVTQLLTLPFGSSYHSISAFGTDDQGEIYALKLASSSSNGQVFKLTRQGGTAPEPPSLLSQTGAFSGLTPDLIPENKLLPYRLRQPFWSDAAHKTRWMAVPNNGSHNQPSEEIGYRDLGEWDWPDGTVWVKHFDLRTDDQDSTQLRRLETRFMIQGDGGQMYGITYRWRNDQTDAELLSDARTDTIAIQGVDGPREVVWYFPGRGECLSCHNEAAGGVLGPKSPQLNCEQYYPLTGRNANQLRTLTHLGMFDSPPDTTQLGSLPTVAHQAEASASLDLRARSYLDANCASCHQPGTGVQANFDARFGTDLAQTGLIYGAPINDLGMHDARLIVPGDLERSVLYQRLASVHRSYAMPNVGKHLLDSVGTQLIADWITQMAPTATSVHPNKQGQRLTFAPIGRQSVDTPTVVLQASSSSGLPVSFAVIDGPATVVGNLLTLSGQPGFVTVEARRSGNHAYHAAPSIRRTFLVAPDSGGTGTGLSATYFQQLDLSDSVLAQVDPEVDFYWGSAGPVPGVAPLTYAVRWQGWLEAPSSGAYTLTVTSDDGARLYVDSSLLIDAWQDQTPTEHSATVNLTAWERVPIQLDYYQRRVFGQIRLSWASANLAPQTVPTAFLYPLAVVDSSHGDTTGQDTSGTDTTVIDSSTRILPSKANSNWQVYPSVLASGQAQVWLEATLPAASELRARLFDLRGQQVARGHWLADRRHEQRWTLPPLPPGVYLLRMETDFGYAVQRLLVR